MRGDGIEAGGDWAWEAGYGGACADLPCLRPHPNPSIPATGQWCALRKAAPHAARWHAHVAEAVTGATALAEAHGLAFKSAAEVAAERVGRGLGGGDTGSFDVGLPGAVQGAVVTRFPPE